MLRRFLVCSTRERRDHSLGPFNFDSALFGNTLVESDGGTFSSQNWLNVTNADPGNPAYLTGANFDTGWRTLVSQAIRCTPLATLRGS